MIRYALKKLVLFSGLAAFLLGMTMCGDSKDDTAAKETAEVDTAEGFLTLDEQRALTAELSIAADKTITDANFDKELESLKNEIEEDAKASEDAK